MKNYMIHDWIQNNTVHAGIEENHSILTEI
jgi:hypothetical protein